jgi:hypothetical protein
MTTTSLEHMLDCSRGDVKEADKVDCHHGVEVLDRVLGEGLADIDSGVVDQRVDLAIALERCVDDSLRRAGVGNIALDGDDARVLALLDRSGRRDHAVAQPSVSSYNTRADAPRGARDDRDLIRLARAQLTR